MISTVVMFQAQNRETINSTWKVAASFKIILIFDDERGKIVFHNTTPDLQDQDQDQDRSVQDQDRFFGLRPVLFWDTGIRGLMRGIATSPKVTRSY